MNSSSRSPLHVTGFVSEQAGSVASANALILKQLIRSEYPITFYSKPEFVDPRPCLAEAGLLDRVQFVDCTNYLTNALRKRLATGSRICTLLLSAIDSSQYNRLLGRKLQASTEGINLWLGDWAKSRAFRPNVSFVQGPPGTDARSVFERMDTFRQLISSAFAIQLRIFAWWKLHYGLPKFSNSDFIIVGSKWSKQCLVDRYRIPTKRIAVIPYPIDLEMFSPGTVNKSVDGPLKALWVGRFAPRKRLEVFLKGLELALDCGAEVEALIVGSSGFVPGYEALLTNFKYPKRLKHMRVVERQNMPMIMRDYDIAVQPSDEENFGSTIAEALACGLPVIVGATNGTSDYICDRSVQLTDNTPQALAEEFLRMESLKRKGLLMDAMPSRKVAESYFSIKYVSSLLEDVLDEAVQWKCR